jgi:hypothetical protein
MTTARMEVIAENNLYIVDFRVFLIVIVCKRPALKVKEENEMKRKRQGKETQFILFSNSVILVIRLFLQSVAFREL